jgi:two-component sensor histidine kinase
VSENNLESQPDRAFRRVIWFICWYAAAAVAVLPVADLALPTIPAITPFVVGGIIVTELSTSFLLFVWFRDAGARPLLPLACAYLWSALMAGCHLMTFPDAILPGEVLFGTRQSAPWTFQLWTNGYAGLTLASVILEASGGHRRVAAENVGRAIVVAAGLVVAAAIGGTFAATAMIDRLPLLMRGPEWTPLNEVVNFAGIAMMLAGVAIVLLAIRRRNVLYLWLALALTAMFFANILALQGGARYTVGWTTARLSWLVSACVLFLFFMNQFSRQQLLLARARTTLEQRVEERTADLMKTIRQRDLLLREVYHRVKNNLQVVNSLITMESRRLENAAARDALGELRNRVYTLGLVHQQLMASDNMAEVSIGSFLRELAENVGASFDATGNGVEVIVVAEPVIVSLDFAISVGLLTTELLANANKYAKATTVTVKFNQSPGGAATLVVRDNRTGSGADRLESRSEIGFQIIEGMISQLDAKMEIVHQDGTRVEVCMPLPEAA